MWFYPAPSLSHGYCAPFFPDPRCDAAHQLYDPGNDFRRAFGTESSQECATEMPTESGSMGVGTANLIMWPAAIVSAILTLY